MECPGKVICTVFLGGALSLLGAANIYAGEEWQGRFEALCSRTGEVMELTPEELQGLLAECEALQAKVEALPESPRKVYRKRLALSCNLVRFALEQKTPALSKE